MALVRVIHAGPRTTVTLARPEQRNAMSATMLRELVDALRSVAVEPQTRVVVLTGEGADFCAGADLDELTVMAAPDEDYGRFFEGAAQAIAAVPVPVVARVQGAALGAGCQLVVACDLAVAADDARLGIPAARLGVLINFENVQRLVLAVGAKRATELLVAARTVDGSEAARWGLVNEAVRAAELDDAVDRLARSIEANAPLTVRGSKRGIAVALEKMSVERETEAHRLADFDMMAAAAFASDDLKEGVRAFRERRPPRFTGS